MEVIADLYVIPMDVGVSVSKEVALCGRILAEAGLKTKLHAYGANIEGELDEVLAGIKRCHDALHNAGSSRVSTTVRFGTRYGQEQGMEDKVRSVEARLSP